MSKKFLLNTPEDNGYYLSYPQYTGHNRTDYPEPLVRVTAGEGGEAILILGSEKTGLYDCGMACFSDKLIENIKCVFEGTGRKVDYIFLSHTHYDHVGALPYILNEWPDAVVCANAKAASVFSKPGAKATMERLGNNAKNLFGVKDVEITAEGLRVDMVLEEGDKISLGDEEVVMYEAKGHTDCSVCYYIMPHKILFTNESTGVHVSPEFLYPSILKSYQQTIDTAEKLKKIDVKWVIAAHYGVLPQELNKSFFDRYIAEARKERKIIMDAIAAGMTYEEILDEHKKVFWTEGRRRNHPFEAYRINAEATVKLTMKDYENGYI
ncbi:MAG: MBL fold metallo-hydrolase [Firmicutes bacterium]|nr:MBL fold metallo-hydrolase [Bacillota bacterium]